MHQGEAEQTIKLLHETEKLKTILRHSWLSSGRRESVAEHTWRMALMAMLMHSFLKKEVDLLKTLKMILVHDLVEINYVDNWAFNKQPTDKEKQERKSLIKLVEPLSPELKVEIISLWKEFEARDTEEAKFAKVLDKFEVLLQHNESDLRHSNKKEITFNVWCFEEYFQYDNYIKAFRELIREETLSIYKKNKIDKKLYEHLSQRES